MMDVLWFTLTLLAGFLVGSEYDRRVSSEIHALELAALRRKLTRDVAPNMLGMFCPRCGVCAFRPNLAGYALCFNCEYTTTPKEFRS